MSTRRTAPETRRWRLAESLDLRVRQELPSLRPPAGLTPPDRGTASPFRGGEPDFGPRGSLGFDTDLWDSSTDADTEFCIAGYDLYDGAVVLPMFCVVSLSNPDNCTPRIIGNSIFLLSLPISADSDRPPSGVSRLPEASATICRVQSSGRPDGAHSSTPRRHRLKTSARRSASAGVSNVAR
jgi:hypothetical protein